MPATSAYRFKVINTPHATLLTSALPIMRKKRDRRVRAGVDRLVDVGTGLNARLGRELVHLNERLPGKTERNRFDLGACSSAAQESICTLAVVQLSCVRQIEQPKETIDTIYQWSETEKRKRKRCSKLQSLREITHPPSPRSKTTRHFMTVPGRQSGAPYSSVSTHFAWISMWDRRSNDGAGPRAEYRSRRASDKRSRDSFSQHMALRAGSAVTNAPNNLNDGVTVLHLASKWPGTARTCCATDAGEAQDTPRWKGIPTTFVTRTRHTSGQQLSKCLYGGADQTEHLEFVFYRLSLELKSQTRLKHQKEVAKFYTNV